MESPKYKAAYYATHATGSTRKSKHGVAIPYKYFSTGVIGRASLSAHIPLAGPDLVVAN